MPRDRARKLRIQKTKEEIEELRKLIKYYQNQNRIHRATEVADLGKEICGQDCYQCIANSIGRNNTLIEELQEKINELNAKLC